MRELGKDSGTCTTKDRCGSYVVIEHNGDVFACDFFVNSAWRLGNVTETSLQEIAGSEKLERFAAAKGDLGQVCGNCEYLGACHGGCRKHRVVLGGAPSDPSYFCKSYKRLYAHALPAIGELASRLRQMGRV